MLLSYSFANFGPFKENVNFSMQPGKIMERYLDNEINLDDKVRILKSAVIVGENGGGKTSFINSLKELKKLISIANKPVKVDINNINANFRREIYASQKYELQVLLSVKNENSFVENYIYHYYLQLDRFGIIAESLSRRRISQKKENEIFNITVKQIDSNPKEFARVVRLVLNEKFFYHNELLEKSLNEYQMGSALNRLAGFCPEVIAPFVDWIENTLVVKSPIFADYSVYAKQDDQTLDILSSPEFFDLFRLIDPTIVKIKIDSKEPYKETKIYREDESGKDFSIPLILESTGIRDFFCWSEQLWKVLKEDKVLFADEVDRVLNPVLASKLVTFVNKSDHQGQFIFTTHNALHLNFEDFRKEQMWIVSKSDSPLCSEMYSIADFSGIRYENTTLYRDYLRGYFGGVGCG